MRNRLPLLGLRGLHFGMSRSPGAARRQVPSSLLGGIICAVLAVTTVAHADPIRMTGGSLFISTDQDISTTWDFGFGLSGPDFGFFAHLSHHLRRKMPPGSAGFQTSAAVRVNSSMRTYESGRGNSTRRPG